MSQFFSKRHVRGVACLSFFAAGLGTQSTAAVIDLTQSASVGTGNNDNFQSVSFDISNDGTNDLTLIADDSTPKDFDESFLTANLAGSDLTNVNLLFDAPGDSAFEAGDIIDSTLSGTSLFPHLLYNEDGDGSFGGPNASGFLGLEVTRNGVEHYAWVALAISGGANNFVLSVTQSGFEDVAGVGIRAGSTDTLAPVPAPASLLLLASGAAGLAALRRRRRARQQ